MLLDTALFISTSNLFSFSFSSLCQRAIFVAYSRYLQGGLVWATEQEPERPPSAMAPLAPPPFVLEDKMFQIANSGLKELFQAGDWFREQSLDKGKELEPRLFELIK